ncbi:MAG TPA: FMN-binding negative transcriptional regulator [Longimicrobium sp.]|nr:FMN-binding negative transcriptional regulator [Longimicrobium sp.]
MIHYEKYTAADADVEALIAGALAGRLVTVDPGGEAHVGIFPFVPAGTVVQLHLTNHDPQLEHLRARGRCLFQVDDVLTTIPSYWIDPEVATYADLYYRSVTLRGRAEVTASGPGLVAHLDALLERHQGTGRHAPVAEKPELYGAALTRLSLVEITVDDVLVKFKLGQQEPSAVRTAIASCLRERAGASDIAAAGFVCRYIPE